MKSGFQWRSYVGWCGDPPLASYLKGDANERFEFLKNYKRIEILQLIRNFLNSFNAKFF